MFGSYQLRHLHIVFDKNMLITLIIRLEHYELFELVGIPELCNALIANLVAGRKEIETTFST